MNSEAKTIGFFGIVTALVLFGGLFFYSRSDTTQNSLAPETNLLINENSHKIATSSAKINLVEFADFQCPACSTYQTVNNKLKEEYKNRINFYYRHFPLPNHKNARIAAEAAEAAGEQGKFFEMSDLLYFNQEDWTEKSDPFKIFLEMAKKLNLNLEQFEKSVKENKHQGKINQDLSDAEKIGVNSTPTIFLDGEKVKNFSYQSLKEKIDSKLAN